MTFSLTSIRHLLIDLDGVLYRGNAALPGAQGFTTWLRDRDIAFRLVTNNSTLTPRQYVEKLAGMGIQVEADEIFTSALAVNLYLEQAGARGMRALLIGEAGLHDAAVRAGLDVVADRPADWVILGLDRQATYHDFAVATLAIRDGARLLASNADASFPTEQGLVPGAGALLALLTTATGVTPTIVGKPEPLMLELAMRQMGGTLSDTAMLGDRLDTDIEAANRLGIGSIMVLTGVSSEADLEGCHWQPDLVVSGLPELERRWQKAA